MAVYTPVEREDLTAFLALYDIGALVSHEPIAEGIENTNYSLVTTQGRYILTLCEARVSAEDLPFILGLMDHLAHKEFPAPKPMRAKSGTLFGTLCARPAAIVRFLEGRAHYEPSATDCAALGHMAATLHLAAQTYPHERENRLAPAGWASLIARLDAKVDGLDGTVRRDIDTVYHQCLTHWPQNLPKGPIHADIFPDNVFFKGASISGVIDYFFACTDFYAYELAICLNAWCFGADSASMSWRFETAHAKALINAYGGTRGLSIDERACLPLLCMGAALRFLVTRLVDYFHVPEGALVTPKNPREYIDKMRFFLCMAPDFFMKDF